MPAELSVASHAISYTQLEVTHPSIAAQARAVSRLLGAECGWTARASEELAICASELTQNLIEHGDGGTLGFAAHRADGRIELTATDLGPGLDPKVAAQNRGSLEGGHGLSALGRLMDATYVSFTPAYGTTIRCVRWGLRAPSWHGVVVTRPHPAETVSGDGALIGWLGDRLRLAVVDGLGHGPQAQAAADLCVDTLRGDAATLDVERAMALAHQRLAVTRGAAVACVDLAMPGREAGGMTVGNVRLLCITPEGERWSPAGADAVLGHGRPGGGRNYRPGPVEAGPAAALVLAFSDGISSRLDLGVPVEVALFDPVRTALRLFAAHASTRDDATLLLAG